MQTPSHEPAILFNKANLHQFYLHFLEFLTTSIKGEPVSFLTENTTAICWRDQVHEEGELQGYERKDW